MFLTVPNTVAVCSFLSFPFLSCQDLMYMSDKPNYPLIQTVLDSLQLELRLLLDPPDGTKERPATTCLELWMCHPEFTSGQSHLQFTSSTDRPPCGLIAFMSLRMIHNPQSEEKSFSEFKQGKQTSNISCQGLKQVSESSVVEVQVLDGTKLLQPDIEISNIFTFLFCNDILQQLV